MGYPYKPTLTLIPPHTPEPWAAGLQDLVQAEFQKRLQGSPLDGRPGGGGPGERPYGGP